MARRMQTIQRRLLELTARVLDSELRSLALLESTAAPRYPVLHRRALMETHALLGLCYGWAEQYEPAHHHWRRSLEEGLQYIEAYWGQEGRKCPYEEAEHVCRVAAVASLLGEEALARRLWEEAQRFAGGLLPGMDRPEYPENTLDPEATAPTMRAYALLRLGRLGGFEATTYERQWPDVKREEPEWRPADIFALLHTVEMQMMRSRAEGYEVFNSERAMLPLLRAMARYRANPGPGLRQEAEQAFIEYVGKIRDTADFCAMPLLALDLQTAYPEILSPVVPPPRP